MSFCFQILFQSAEVRSHVSHGCHSPIVHGWWVIDKIVVSVAETGEPYDF